MATFENAERITGPTDGATIERAVRLADFQMFTVALQRRRLSGSEPEDEEFLFRRWTDLELMIVGLRRLRRVPEMFAKSHPSYSRIRKAAVLFDAALPNLKKMRDVAEHIDEYANDRGQSRLSRKQLEVGSWDGGAVFSHLGETFDVDHALKTAETLFAEIRKARDAFPKATAKGSRNVSRMR